MGAFYYDDDDDERRNQLLRALRARIHVCHAMYYDPQETTETD